MILTMPSWFFWALLSAIFAALTAIFAKIGVQDVNPDFAMLLRTVLITLTLGVLLAVTGKIESVARFSGRTWLFLALSALGTGASWFCYFRALKVGDAAKVAPVDKLSVVIVAVIAAALLGEKLSVFAWAGIVLITGGVILVAIG